jgi:hypothetical protein
VSIHGDAWCGQGLPDAPAEMSTQNLLNISKIVNYPRIRPWRPTDYEMLRLINCLDNRLTDGGEVVRLAHRLHSTPYKHRLYFSLWY